MKRLIVHIASVVVIGVALWGAWWACGVADFDRLSDDTPAEDALIHVTPHNHETVAICPSLSGFNGHAIVGAASDGEPAPEAVWEPGGSQGTTIPAASNGHISATTTTDIQGGIVRARPPHSGAAEPIGAVSGWIDKDTQRGLAASVCDMPQRSAWFVGAETATGYTTSLILTNPGNNPTDVTLRAWDATGAVEVEGATTTVSAASSQTVRLDAHFSMTQRLVIHVSATGEGVVSAMITQGMDGLTPVGADIVSATAEPANLVTIPGVTIGHGQSFIRMANPNAKQATVTLRTARGDKLTPLPGATGLTIAPNAVVDVSLLGIKPGIYGVVAQADQPIVGAAYVATSPKQATDGVMNIPDDAPTPADHDYAWIPAATPQTQGLLVVPPGTKAQVGVAADNPATVSLTQGKTHHHHDITTHGTWELSDGVWTWTSTAPVSMGVSLSTPDNDGIAYLTPLASATQAGSIGIQMYP